MSSVLFQRNKNIEAVLFTSQKKTLHLNELHMVKNKNFGLGFFSAFHEVQKYYNLLGTPHTHTTNSFYNSACNKTIVSHGIFMFRFQNMHFSNIVKILFSILATVVDFS